MNKATKVAVDRGLISKGGMSEIYEQGENRTAWHDPYFLHLLEVVNSEEIIYQSRPLAGRWMVEDA